MKNFYSKNTRAVLITAFLQLFICVQSFSQTGNVLSLDGSAGTYMSVADHDDIDINPGESYTITCKIKTTTTVANPRIVAKRNGVSGTAVGYEFISSATGQFGGNLRSTPVSAGPAFSTATINNGQWRHIAMVVDQVAGNSKIYVDGVLDKTSTTWGTPQDFSNAMALIIGADATASHLNLWTGQIDNIRFWNKAMVAVEVNGDRSAVISGPVTNLVACWDFDNAVAPTVPDVSGNNHPGSLNGNATILAVNNNMVYQATTLSQTELPAGRGDANQRIIAVNVVTSGADNPISLTAINFTMNGTSTIADVSNVKIYYTGSSNRFNTNSLFSTLAPAAGIIAANGTQTLIDGNNYFWIAYDVVPGAAEGNLLDAGCQSVTVGGVLQTLSTTTIAGSRTILLAHQLLYSAGDYGSANYRIPAIVTAADGSLVTAADKRINGAADLPANIDIIVRRSIDNGQTWAAPIVIADLGTNGASDPALVVDKATGKIICLFATNNGVFASTPVNPIRIQYCSSMDNGITWSAVTDITSQIYGPTGWYAAWVASGRAHQLRNGRIVAAVGVRQTSGSQLDNFMIYSDDGGTTWSPSTGIAEANGDEAKIVELNNGNLMMSIRNAGTRRMNVSASQGASWGTAYNQTDITDPNCDGDFVRYTSTVDGYDKNRLLHTIPFAGTRRNVSVLVSYDEGISWPVNKTIYPGASAYSSITVLPDGTLGMFYENGEYESYQLYFARFSLNWLTNGTDTYLPSATLPVSMLSFKGTMNNNRRQAELHWTTTNEINTGRFDVEYGTDGRNFNRISAVKANNSAGINIYSFSHTNITATVGDIYYRLRSVDNDGKFKYSDILRFNLDGNKSVSIYPNPVIDKLIVTAPEFDPGKMQILSAATGAILRTIAISSQSFTVDMTSFPKGTYIIKFMREKSVEIIKLLKK